MLDRDLLVALGMHQQQCGLEVLHCLRELVSFQEAGQGGLVGVEVEPAVAQPDHGRGVEACRRQQRHVAAHARPPHGQRPGGQQAGDGCRVVDQAIVQHTLAVAVPALVVGDRSQTHSARGATEVEMALLA